MPETNETIGCPGPHCARCDVSPNRPRFFEDSDESGHRFMVPVAKKAEWAAWLDLDPDDEASWDAPEWAMRIDGGTLTFTDPKIERL